MDRVGCDVLRRGLRHDEPAAAGRRGNRNTFLPRVEPATGYDVLLAGDGEEWPRLDRRSGVVVRHVDARAHDVGRAVAVLGHLRSRRAPEAAAAAARSGRLYVQ